MNRYVSVFAALIMGFGLLAYSQKSEALSDPLTRFVAWTVTCDSTARSLKPASGFVPSKGFEITNGSAIIFLGGSTVNTTTLGYPIAASAAKSIDGHPGALFCVSATSSVVELLGAD